MIDLGPRLSSSMSSSTVQAVRARLEIIGAVDDPLGQAALVFARILDSDEEGSSARVSAGKELRTTLETLGIPHRPGPVDELRAKREARMGRAQDGRSS